MSSLGVVILCHAALGRVAEVTRFWAKAGVPVVLHVDQSVPTANLARLQAAVGDLDGVTFARRHRCEWGTWGIVAATQAATDQMLWDYPDVKHVLLSSGSCLPLRPAEELRAWLADRPGTDFIESVAIEETKWTKGGLEAERFRLRFPFAWRRQRALFDGSVWMQRKLGIKRRLPKGIVPHMGSQWWCLSRQTLVSILHAQDREEMDRFFRRSWIPDESYFQTLARRYATEIESQSLTFSKFDFQGKPHVLYDDHLPLLRRSNCFVARKVWPGAQGLYDAFLAGVPTLRAGQPNPARVERVFARAQSRRTKGRRGLYNQGRFPRAGWERDLTAGPYRVFQGLSEVFDGFEDWLGRDPTLHAHGRLFAPDRAVFAEGTSVARGGLSDAATLRDADPRAFLTNLLWASRGRAQAFQFGPADEQDILPILARDPNARVTVISGAWAIPLFERGGPVADIRAEAARLQATEDAGLRLLNARTARAEVDIFPLSQVLGAPQDMLRATFETRADVEDLVLRDLKELPGFLRALRDEGVTPHAAGDLLVGPPVSPKRLGRGALARGPA